MKTATTCHTCNTHKPGRRSSADQSTSKQCMHTAGSRHTTYTVRTYALLFCITQAPNDDTRCNPIVCAQPQAERCTQAIRMQQQQSHRQWCYNTVSPHIRHCQAEQLSLPPPTSHKPWYGPTRLPSRSPCCRTQPRCSWRRAWPALQPRSRLPC